MTTPLRAVLYLRLSALVEDSTSIDRQEHTLRERAQLEGWEVVRVLADEGISGRKHRENADEALRMIRDGEADILAVWALDRFTRQGIGAVGRLVDALDAAPGARFVTLKDGLDSSSSTWRLIASVLSEIARTEAENASARIKSAIAYRKTVTNRFTGGGTIPFGYASVPAPEGVGRVLIANPTEAEIVREVADWILDRGLSLTAVVRELNAREIPTSKSPYRRALYRGTPDAALSRGSWSVSTIRALWTSETLLGRVSLGTSVVRDDDGVPLQVWEPILDLDTMERLRARLTSDEKKPARRRTARLLSGLAFCAYCDRKMYVTSSGGTPLYACPASWNGGECKSPKVNALNLEGYVADYFLRSRGNDPEYAIETTVENPGVASELAEVEAALREASADLLADDADEAAVLRRVGALKVRRTELRSVSSKIVEQLAPTGRTLAEAWHADEDDEARRSVLLAGLDHVTIASGRRVKGIDPERVGFVWAS